MLTFDLEVLSRTLRKSQEKTCDGVLRKAQAATYKEWKFVKFFRTILSKTTFGECFCFGGWPCAALSRQKVFDLAH